MKEEMGKNDKIQRDQLLKSAMEDAAHFDRLEERKKEQHAVNLRKMHEDNLRTEKERSSVEKRVQKTIDE